VSRRKKTFDGQLTSGFKNRFLSLVVVLLLIAAVFLFLEKMKHSGRIPEQSSPITEDKQNIAQQPAPVYVQDVYTSGHTSEIVKAPGKVRSLKHGSIAIIIDDMGASIKDADRLLSINLPVTFAVIPGLAHSRRVAEAAHAKGQVVMIHIPMEPQGYPAQRLEANGLLVSQSEDEISEKVKGYLREVPHATGANNHMGSSFTEHEDKMMPVLEILKKNGLFFIDSRTSSSSVGYAMAARMGLKAGTRNVFLDNEQSVDKVKTQLKAAVTIAEKRGSAIAIGHPHASTIRALQEMMPELQREGITFVSAGRLVR